MYRAWCDMWEKEVLVWPSAIENMANADRGIVLSYKIACGNHGHLLTGAASHTTVTGHPRH